MFLAAHCVKVDYYTITNFMENDNSQCLVATFKCVNLLLWLSLTAELLCCNSVKLDDSVCDVVMRLSLHIIAMICISKLNLLELRVSVQSRFL